MEITFEDNGSPLKRSKNRKGETCEEQLRRMCKEIADDISNPKISKDDGGEAIELQTAHEWMEGVYDIEWITFQDGSFKGARLLVAGGGPTIWVNVKTDEVEGYWAGDHCTQAFQDNLELRSYLEELHASSK
jgi:hypothetical protein